MCYERHNVSKTRKPSEGQIQLGLQLKTEGGSGLVRKAQGWKEILSYLLIIIIPGSPLLCSAEKDYPTDAGNLTACSLRGCSSIVELKSLSIFE